jgi:hypothetical protein
MVSPRGFSAALGGTSWPAGPGGRRSLSVDQQQGTGIPRALVQRGFR